MSRLKHWLFIRRMKRWRARNDRNITIARGRIDALNQVLKQEVGDGLD